MNFGVIQYGTLFLAIIHKGIQDTNYYVIYDGKPVLPSLHCEDFEQLLLTSTVFVDKTLLIEEFLNDDNATATQTQIIIRPPGWGKTLNMDMMRRFFQIPLDPNGYLRRSNPNRRLFFGGKLEYKGRRKRLNPLKIAALKNFTKKYLGKHPVIWLSMGKVSGQTHRQLYDDWLAPKIRNLYQNEYGFLRKYTQDGVTLIGAPLKERLKRYYADVPLTMEDLEMSLNTLVQALYHHLNGTTVFVFIDQYDEPFVYGYENFDVKEYDKFYAIIMKFFVNTFEHNETRSYLEKGLMTGVFPMILNTNITDLDDPSIYTLMHVDIYSMMERAQKYSPYYGFYEREVRELMRKTESTVPFSILKKWYNGFNYTKYYVYNPVSTNECLRTNKLGIYWYNTTRLNVVKKTATSFLVQLLITMLIQGYFTTSVYTFLNYEDFGCEHGQISTLLHAGMFSVRENERLEFADSGTETLMLPNTETELILQRYTISWTCQLYNLDESFLYASVKKYRRPITEAMMDYDEHQFKILMQEYLESFPVSFSNKEHAQRFYIWVIYYLFASDDRSGQMIKRYKYDFDYDNGPKALEAAFVQAPLRQNKSAIILLRTEDYTHPYELIVELKFIFKYIKTLAVYELVFYGKNKAQYMYHVEQQKKKADKFRWSDLVSMTTTDINLVRRKLPTVPKLPPGYTESTTSSFSSYTEPSVYAFSPYTQSDTIEGCSNSILAHETLPASTKYQSNDTVDVSTTKPHTKRTIFNWRQLQILEQTYNSTKYPDKDIIKALSQRINVSEKVIGTWFTNERLRKRKARHNENEQQMKYFDTPDSQDEI